MLVHVKNVTRDFIQGEITVHALRGIDLEISEGEFTALVGPSGSGKTTLLNCIGVLDVPTDGEIFFQNEPMAALKGKDISDFRLHKLGFIFQAYNLIPVFTALENVEYILTLQKVDKKSRRERALAVLKDMGLESLQNRFPRELSGGQQQRVAVARALVSKPALILADEPTANLDTENAEKLLDLMGMMSENLKTTFLFSTHDERVMKRAHRIVHLLDGKITNEK